MYLSLYVSIQNEVKRIAFSKALYAVSLWLSVLSLLQSNIVYMHI